LEWYGDVDYILGYEKGEFPRTIDAWEKIIHPKDHDRVMKALDEHLKNTTPYQEEYRVIGKNHRIRYWLDSGTAIFDSNGTAYRMIGACSDITEKKLAEEQVIWQNNLLDAVNTILQETIFSENDEDVVHAFLLIIMNLTNSDYGFLGEINKKEELEHLYFNASDIEPRVLPDNARDLMVQQWKERGIWETVVKNGKVFSANDIKSYLTEIKAKPSHPDVMAFLAVPLKYAGLPNGILAIARKTHEYDDYDIQALKGISGVFTEVLNVKRLEIELKKRVQTLESKVKVNRKRNKKRSTKK
jgi:PAS domain S-box-containing protein